jgi:hypothetical protein
MTAAGRREERPGSRVPEANRRSVVHSLAPAGQSMHEDLPHAVTLPSAHLKSAHWLPMPRQDLTTWFLSRAAAGTTPATKRHIAPRKDNTIRCIATSFSASPIIISTRRATCDVIGITEKSTCELIPNSQIPCRRSMVKPPPERSAHRGHRPGSSHRARIVWSMETAARFCCPMSLDQRNRWLAAVVSVAPVAV